MKSSGNSKLLTVYTYLSSAVTLSLLWWVCCIPIITIGASTAALFNSAMIFTERGNVKPFRLFKESFKKFFKPATICWSIFLAIAILIGVDYIFFMNVAPGALGIVKVISLILIVTWAFIVLYLFPVICTFSGTTIELIFNSLILSFMNAPQTILMFIVYIGGAFVGGKALYYLSYLLLMYSGLGSTLSSSANVITIMSSALFYIFLLPGAATLINGLLFKKVFKPYISPEYVRYNSLCK